MNKLTQINLFEGEGYKGFGPLGLDQKSAEDAPAIFTNFISSAIGLISVIAVIWFVFVLITGALGLITSGGDKNTAETSKKKITSGLIGLILTIIGVWLVRFVAFIFGLGDVLDVGNLLELIQIK